MVCRPASDLRFLLIVSTMRGLVVFCCTPYTRHPSPHNVFVAKRQRQLWLPLMRYVAISDSLSLSLRLYDPFYTRRKESQERCFSPQNHEPNQINHTFRITLQQALPPCRSPGHLLPFLDHTSVSMQPL